MAGVYGLHRQAVRFDIGVIENEYLRWCHVPDRLLRTLREVCIQRFEDLILVELYSVLTEIIGIKGVSENDGDPA